MTKQAGRNGHAISFGVYRKPGNDRKNQRSAVFQAGGLKPAQAMQRRLCGNGKRRSGNRRAQRGGFGRDGAGMQSAV